jgi:hypothetical protein
MEKNKCLVCGQRATNFVGDTMEDLCDQHFEQRYERTGQSAWEVVQSTSNLVYQLTKQGLK